MNQHAPLAQALHRIWSSKGLISTLLLPLSWLTRWVVTRKASRYNDHPERIWQSPIPIMIVGNIFIGGTGKTPVVMALIDALTQRGWNPGVISRGYGVRIGKQARTGQGTLDPAQFGDEPALIAQTTGAPVAVHPSRVLAAQTLIRNYPQVDVIVADDGLQHLALGRDVEIIVQDHRGAGNGRLLPAGPLREPASKLAEVDVIVTNNTQDTNHSRLPPTKTRPAPESPPDEGPVHRQEKPMHVHMTLIPHDVVHLKSGQQQLWSTWLENHRDSPISAVAAIGHPDRFFTMLRCNGLSLHQTLALADHTDYTNSTLDGINTEIILVTTKDAVKCVTLNDGRLWAVRVTPSFSNTDWLDTIHNKLVRAAHRKNPDRHDTLN